MEDRNQAWLLSVDLEEIAQVSRQHYGRWTRKISKRYEHLHTQCHIIFDNEKGPRLWNHPYLAFVSMQGLCIEGNL